MIFWREKLIAMLIGVSFVASCGSKSSKDKKDEVVAPQTGDKQDDQTDKKDDQIKITGDKDVKQVDKPVVVNVADLVKQGDQEGVEREINSGSANVNMRDDDGRTLLMLASLYNRLSLSKFLVEKGADFELKDKENHDAIELAEASGHAHIATYLKMAKEARSKPDPKPTGTPDPNPTGTPDPTPTATPGGGEIPPKEPGLTPEQLAELNGKLLEACEKGEVDNVKALIELGADANFSDEKKLSGMTPIFLAISKANVALANTLIDLKIDRAKKVKLRRLGEKTPLEYAEYLLSKETASSPARERFEKIIEKLKG